MTSKNRKGTDRKTDRPIVEIHIRDDARPWASGTKWIFSDVSRDLALEAWKDERPVPKEYCMASQESGSMYCRTKVRPENVRAQLYACGRHMARFQEEIRRQERYAQDAKRREEAQALKDWQLKEYTEVFQRLQELGWGDYLDKEPSVTRWGRSIENTNIEFDLKEFLELVDPEDYDEEEEDIEDEGYTSVEADFFQTLDV